MHLHLSVHFVQQLAATLPTFFGRLVASVIGCSVCSSVALAGSALYAQILLLTVLTPCISHFLSQAAGRAAAAVAAAGRRAGAGSAAPTGTADEDPAVAAAKAAAAEFMDVSSSCTDGPLQAAIEAGHVSFVHQVTGQAGSWWGRVRARWLQLRTAAVVLGSIQH